MKPHELARRFRKWAEGEISAVEKREGYSQSRAHLYKFLSEAFLAPVNEETHKVFANPELFDGLKEVFSQETLSHFDEFRKTGVTEELKQEFENLLRVPGPWYTTPYESVYVDKREISGEEVGNLLHGKSAHDVEKLYRRFGLKVGGAAPDLPDYIGIELSFMAHIAHLENQSDSGFETGQLGKTRKDFLKNHLLDWVPFFCETLIKKSQGGYYKGIAKMLLEFLKIENDEWADKTDSN